VTTNGCLFHFLNFHFLNTEPPHVFAIRLVQYCAAISATAEFLLSIHVVHRVSNLNNRFQSFSLLFYSTQKTLKVCLHRPSARFTVQLSRYRDLLTWTGRPIATCSPEQCHGCSSASDNRCVLARCMRRRMPWYCRGSIPSTANAAVQCMEQYAKHTGSTSVAAIIIIND